MKVCKKCKKKVANKTKVCKYCGADVSKCKIIKNPSSNNKGKKNTQKKKTEPILKNEDKVSTNSKILDANKKDINKTKLNNKNTDKGKRKKITDNNKNNLNNNRDKVLSRKEKIINKLRNFFDFLLKYKVFNKINLWLIIVLFLVIVVFCSLYFISNCNDSNNSNKGLSVTSTNNDFDMNEIVNYKGVNYRVLNVKTSTGNNYKKPEEGNQFLIVTISIENDTDEKIKYSYNNWTVSNSDSKKDSKRIFTSLNVDNALYSGNLVVGGVKKGSMVFEQPIDASEIRLNYYELKKNKDGSFVIDEDKKMFSIKLDILKDDDLDNELEEK